MEKQQYNISAAITTYKRDWTVIERAIQSILGQTYPVKEILLIDDNGLDSPFCEKNRQEAARFPMVRYIPMEKNSGVAKARNRAIAEAEYEWIAFCDDDDEWLPFKLDFQTGLLDRHPGAVLAYGIGELYYDDTGERENVWQYDHFMGNPTYADILHFDYVGSIHLLVRTDVMRSLGGFRTEGLPAVEDYEMWIRVAQKYTVVGERKVIAIFHMDHQQHISTNLSNTFRAFVNIYRMYQDDYRKYPEAHAQILWNICRDGIKSRHLECVPYIFRWFAVRAGLLVRTSRKGKDTSANA